MKILPPEIVQPILDILSYLGAAFLGWLSKKLTTKKEKVDGKG